MRVARMVVVLALGGTVGLAGCADPVSLSGTGATGRGALPVVLPIPSVVAQVPSAVKTRGQLVFATDAPDPPLVFFKSDNKTLTGYDVDLGNAIGAAMGLPVRWVNTSFDSILPGLQAGKYDAGMSDFSITPDRLGTLDFVSYYLSGGGFLIKKGSGVKIGSFDDLCGYRAAVQKGASQLSALDQANAACTGAGKRPIDVLQEPNQDELALTLASGRADVVVADKSLVTYTAGQSSGQLCVVSTYQTDHSLAGIAVPKAQPGLLDALRAAITALIKDGDYAKIGKVWNVGIPQPGAALSPTYAKVVAPLGIGSDGTLAASEVFIDPKSIHEGSSYYFQPVTEGCA